MCGGGERYRSGIKKRAPQGYSRDHNAQRKTGGKHYQSPGPYVHVPSIPRGHRQAYVRVDWSSRTMRLRLAASSGAKAVTVSGAGLITSVPASKAKP